LPKTVKIEAPKVCPVVPGVYIETASGEHVPDSVI
jgi:hypothetical protein